MTRSKLTFITDTFRCNLECGRCTFIKENNERCRNRVCMGYPLCWIHTKRRYGVQSRQSCVHGKGLFATRDIPAESWIAPYGGETISQQCLDYRYPGDMTAPYAVDEGGDSYKDGACNRGIGALSNARFRRDGMVSTPARHNAEIAHRNGQLWLRSTKAIPTDEEIFTYYGDMYRLEDTHVTKRTTRSDNRPC